MSSEVSLDDVQDHFWHWAHDDGGKGTLTRAEANPLVSAPMGTLPGSVEDDDDEDMTPVPERSPNSRSGFSFPPHAGEQGNRLKIDEGLLLSSLIKN